MTIIPHRASGFFAKDAIGGHRATSGSTTSIALSTAYVHQTSGNAVALRWAARTAQPINELLMFQTAVAGTGGAIRCRIYNEGVGVTQPGATLRATSSSTSSTAVANRWVKFTFDTPYTPAVGEILWLILDNTDAAPATNNASFHSAVSAGIQDSSIMTLASQGYSSTVGFSAGGTASNRQPHLVKEGSLWYGNPFNMAISSPGLSTRKKGIRFTPRKTVKIMAIDLVSGAANYDKFQIFTPGQLPNDTPFWETDLDSDSNRTTLDLLGTKYLDPSVQPILTAGVEYTAVLTYATAAMGITFATIADYVGGTYEADIDAVRLNDTHNLPIYVNDDGANNWLTDKTLFVSIRLIYDQILDTSFSGFIAG